MYCVGLDIHQRSTSVGILDQNGKSFKRFEIKEPWPKLASRVAEQTPARHTTKTARSGWTAPFEIDLIELSIDQLRR
jgi:hypothetical protein